MAMKTNQKRWTIIFRALANINRLKIIALLSDGRAINVGEIAESLEISFKATSNHLILLKNLDVLDAKGTSGHVLYSSNVHMPADFRAAINLLE
ncbi:MAG: winged helix-turn-helix transcriptional regulator [Candidatus Liptonbacteria bacterium]|nr:winged helix-turn-helix transcriptional regulator [Candidatus Liptonbacteria bacterium]